jgi:hypothetical protein
MLGKMIREVINNNTALIFARISPDIVVSVVISIVFKYPVIRNSIYPSRHKTIICP